MDRPRCSAGQDAGGIDHRTSGRPPIERAPLDRHRRNLALLPDVAWDTLTGFIAADCRKWVLVGSSAGQALSLICTPHPGIPRLIEISGWLW
jgi:hypothetical protein